MRTHWDAINDFMMGKYFHKRLYEYYPQRPICFVDFLANPSDQTYFFKESSLYVYYLLLVISLFFKSLYFYTSTANVLFYQLNLMVLQLRLDFKKKVVVFRWTNSNLDGAVLKYFWCQTGSVIYRHQRLLLYLK